MADFGSLFETVSVLNQVPELRKSLANNDIPVSGYIQQEIIKYSLKSPTDCDQLLHFLLAKLQRDEPPRTKLKALKLIGSVVNNGNPRFRQNLPNRDWLIKDAAAIGAINADPIYEAIRTEAKDLLVDIYANSCAGDSIAQSGQNSTANSTVLPSNTGEQHLGGMGSSGNRGKMEGFGNTPSHVMSNKTTMSKVVDGLSDVFSKLLNPSEARTEITDGDDVGGYKAVSLPLADATLETSRIGTTSVPSVYRSKQLTENKKSSYIEAHTPGCAGGGWDKENMYDDFGSSSGGKLTAAPAESRNCSSQSVVSTDSLEKPGENDIALFEAENQLVQAICTNVQSDANQLKPFHSMLELDGLCRRCSTLNCDKLIELLNHRLVTGQENVVKMRILMLVEVFLNQDIVSPERLLDTFEHGLLQLQNTDSNDLKVKSTKVLLILRRLRQDGDGPDSLIQT